MKQNYIDWTCMCGVKQSSPILIELGLMKHYQEKMVSVGCVACYKIAKVKFCLEVILLLPDKE